MIWPIASLTLLRTIHRNSAIATAPSEMLRHGNATGIAWTCLRVLWMREWLEADLDITAANLGRRSWNFGIILNLVTSHRPTSEAVTEGQSTVQWHPDYFLVSICMNENHIVGAQLCRSCTMAVALHQHPRTYVVICISTQEHIAEVWIDLIICSRIKRIEIACYVCRRMWIINRLGKSGVAGIPVVEAPSAPWSQPKTIWRWSYIVDHAEQSLGSKALSRVLSREGNKLIIIWGAPSGAPLSNLHRARPTRADKSEGYYN